MLGNPIEATEASEAPMAVLRPDRRKERREVRGRGRDIFWGQAIGYPRFGQGREVVLGGGMPLGDRLLRSHCAPGGTGSRDTRDIFWWDRR